MAWFKVHNIEVDFYNLKEISINNGMLNLWCKEVGWETLLNKKGATWRKMPTEEQALITEEAAAIALMIETPSIIKRPVIELRDKLIVGFDENGYKKEFL